MQDGHNRGQQADEGATRFPKQRLGVKAFHLRALLCRSAILSVLAHKRTCE